MKLNQPPHKAIAHTMCLQKVCFLPTLNQATTKATEKRGSWYKHLQKLAVQWLNEALCFISSFVVSDSLMLRNPLLRLAPKR